MDHTVEYILLETPTYVDPITIGIRVIAMRWYNISTNTATHHDECDLI
jgi:hypothetical protein